MTGTSIIQDIEWLADTAQRFMAVNERIKKMVPENPSLFDNRQMAYIHSAQAIRGCERTLQYLRMAAREVVGGQ